MIIDKHKCIFIHIPKTGGSSIEKALAPEFLSGSLISNQVNYDYFTGWCPKKKIWMHHATMLQINEFHEKDTTNYFSFGIVRNPYERAVSDWMWMLRTSKIHKKGKAFLNYLKEDGIFYERLKTTDNKRTRADHILPQCEFLLNESGDQLVDFIGKFENLQEDFNIVCDKIGIPKQQLPHKNKSKHKHYTEYYDDETRQIVAEKYAKDIEYFGYKF